MSYVALLHFRFRILPSKVVNHDVFVSIVEFPFTSLFSESIWLSKV